MVQLQALFYKQVLSKPPWTDIDQDSDMVASGRSTSVAEFHSGPPGPALSLGKLRQLPQEANLKRDKGWETATCLFTFVVLLLKKWRGAHGIFCVMCQII